MAYPIARLQRGAARSARPGERSFRMSEVVSALTYALDLTEGQPEGHTLRSCCIGMRIGQELDLGHESASALFYTLLLKDTGCSSNSAALSAMFRADDHAVKRDAKTTDWTGLREGASYIWRNVSREGGTWSRVRHFARISTGAETGSRQLIRIRCERGASIVGRLGFGAATTIAIRSLDEHWDGSGHPDGRRGRDIPLNARIALLAQTLEVFLGGGADAALDMVRRRRRSWFDPELVDLVTRWRNDTAWWASLGQPDLRAMVTALEPGDITRSVDDAGLDQVASAFAEVIDAKSPYTYNHSSGVAAWACRIGEVIGLDEGALRDLYRAGLLHDIGKLGVSNRILDKPGRLTAEEFAVVRRHPEWTLGILGRVPAFAEFAHSASCHHERMDGSGYPWRLDGSRLDAMARILAVADMYEALTADRPYRPGLPPETVLQILRGETPALHDPAVLEALECCVRADAAEAERPVRAGPIG